MTKVVSHNKLLKIAKTQCHKSHKCTSALLLLASPLLYYNAVINWAQKISFLMTLP